MTGIQLAALITSLLAIAAFGTLNGIDDCKKIDLKAQ
jgi:hypothetical protein